MYIKRNFLWCECLVLILLVGCAKIIPVSTSTVPPSLTPSPKPTLTPSITPSPTITPTPLPPTPEGAQGFDNARNLATKTENETSYYYIPETSGWAIALNQMPIWLVDEKNSAGDIASGLPNGYKSMSIYYYRMPDSSQTFYSVEEPSKYASGATGNGEFSTKPNMFHTTQDYVAMVLAERLNGVEEKDLTAPMLKEVLNKIADHSLILALDIPKVAKDNSQITTKYWDPNNNIDFIEVPWGSTKDDPSFFGQRSFTYRWKLDVRGGKDESNPGNLVVIYATSYTFRLHDWEEADIHLLGPIYVALQGQQEPRLDYVAFGGADLNNFIDEYWTIKRTKKLNKEELDKLWQTFHYEEMTDFSHSASISAFWAYPFMDFQCFHFEKDGTQTIINCYAPSDYLIKKSRGIISVVVINIFNNKTHPTQRGLSAQAESGCRACRDTHPPFAI